MMPISVGIPFFNAEPYLANAIRSVFAQSYEDWELILVDDGSTDNSLEIARAVRDARVRVVSDGENKRLSARLNQITAEAKYEFVARMDADDLISPHRLQKQVSALQAHPEMDLVTTGIVSISRDKRPIGVRYALVDYVVTGRRLLSGNVPICHASILARKSWMLRNQYGATPRGQDFELWVRASAKNDLRILFLPDPLYYYWEGNNLNPEKLLGDYVLQRKAYKEFGPLWFQPWELAGMFAKSYAKGVAVRALWMADRMDVLVKRRNLPVGTDHELAVYEREIAEVLGTKVPGLD